MRDPLVAEFRQMANRFCHTQQIVIHDRRNRQILLGARDSDERDIVLRSEPQQGLVTPSRRQDQAINPPRLQLIDDDVFRRVACTRMGDEREVVRRRERGFDGVYQDRQRRVLDIR